ncbi:MAG: LytTR family DNA-binding domain-containing protein, partial [Gemmatimonadaceae bacterium]
TGNRGRMTQTLLRVMLVDDEPLAREGLRLRLKREPDVIIVGEFADVPTALQAIRSDSPDVLFLDVEMPLLDGFALLEKTRDVAMPLVVFVTAHDKHAVRAFDARAMDYLLKPVEQTRLRQALDRVAEHVERTRMGEFGEQVRGLMRSVNGHAVPENTHSAVQRIPVTVDGTIHFVSVADVDYVEASGDVVRLHSGKVVHSLRKSMGEVLAMFDPSKFVRIHRSHIVNVERIAKMEPYFHGEYVVVLRDGTKLKLSRSYRAAVSKLLGLTVDLPNANV